MTTSGKDKRLAEMLMSFIEDNLDKRLTIEVLSGHFHVSSFSLQRVCRLMFDKPVHQLIIDKRLETAYPLVRTTDIPLKQVASMTGFRSVATFTTEFHQKFGITPGALRSGW